MNGSEEPAVVYISANVDYGGKSVVGSRNVVYG